ncbi:hypothetical protein A2U01_0059863, partial [Trifolium medium]|nr:hypothetical protein [Trifolium medium]
QLTFDVRLFYTSLTSSTIGLSA